MVVTDDYQLLKWFCPHPKCRSVHSSMIDTGGADEGGLNRCRLGSGTSTPLVCCEMVARGDKTSFVAKWGCSQRAGLLGKSGGVSQRTRMIGKGGDARKERGCLQRLRMFAKSGDDCKERDADNERGCW